MRGMLQHGSTREQRHGGGRYTWRTICSKCHHHWWESQLVCPQAIPNVASVLNCRFIPFASSSSRWDKKFVTHCQWSVPSWQQAPLPLTAPLNVITIILLLTILIWITIFWSWSSTSSHNNPSHRPLSLPTASLYLWVPRINLILILISCKLYLVVK